MRAGYSGSQRFGMIPWSGDVSRGWGGLQSQMEISLQMGMQGQAYMHSDLGGFAGPVLDDELYVRWLQYGVFQPVFRPHAQESVPAEPVFREPATKALAREAIRLRYAMLPYNYTIAFENSRSGMPLMRPIVFEEPENDMVPTPTISSTYLWGADFLVAPVTEPGALRKEVYFPHPGSTWFDFYTGQAHRGGIIETVPTVREHIPTYVRAGAFVPLAAPVQRPAIIRRAGSSCITGMTPPSPLPRASCTTTTARPQAPTRPASTRSCVSLAAWRRAACRSAWRRKPARPPRRRRASSI
jgi:oligosaccharide 4-alpha-D-glucosyltransferase